MNLQKKNLILNVLNILNTLWRFLFSLLSCEEPVKPISSAENVLNSNLPVN